MPQGRISIQGMSSPLGRKRPFLPQDFPRVVVETAPRILGRYFSLCRLIGGATSLGDGLPPSLSPVLELSAQTRGLLEQLVSLEPTQPVSMASEGTGA